MAFFVGNEEDGANLSALYVFFPSFALLRERVGRSFTSYLDLRRDHLKWWVDEREYEKLNELILEKLDDDEFFALVKRRTIELSDEVYAFSRALAQRSDADYSKTEASELVALQKRHSALVSEMLSWAMLVTTIELPNGLYMKKFDDFVAARAKEKRLPPQGDYAAVLSTPLEESNAKREFKSLLQIAAEIEADAQAKRALLANKSDAAKAFAELKRVSPALAEKLGEHAREFGWVYYGYSGPAWSAADFARETAEILSEKNAATALKETEERDAALARKQREYEKIFACGEKDARIVQVARGLGLIKAYRKESMFYAYFAIERVQREFGKRFALTLDEVRLLAPGELEDVAKGKFDLNKLKQRAEFALVEQRGGDGSNETRVFEGAAAAGKAKAFAERKIADASELRGVCAQPGFVRGVVRVVNKPADVAKMDKGDVLVSIATTPDLVTAMRKAAAIVTDLGGLTCHAAIVSRELGIPCVVGTRVATKIFKDGDEVEVDAGNGIVRKTGKTVG